MSKSSKEIVKRAKDEKAVGRGDAVVESTADEIVEIHREVPRDAAAKWAVVGAVAGGAVAAIVEATGLIPPGSAHKLIDTLKTLLTMLALR